MRESNLSNPIQGKAAVCITAVVYDRRGTFVAGKMMSFFESSSYATRMTTTFCLILPAAEHN